MPSLEPQKFSVTCAKFCQGVYYCEHLTNEQKIDFKYSAAWIDLWFGPKWFPIIYCLLRPWLKSGINF